jgi:hypothetical protein
MGSAIILTVAAVGCCSLSLIDRVCRFPANPSSTIFLARSSLVSFFVNPLVEYVIVNLVYKYSSVNEIEISS